ncbi:MULTISPECIES: GNAT family N-acetyltransferase [unclassified Pseudomonas]|uniref:GNAT family N-acetyltransferase n=1 Tax=Pseudomonas TaxID=286 RepID=UPI001E2B9416|nr:MULTISPECIES: GNAT family N-acetyltransferase [unclassified Pseudomonas]MDH1693158.1 GNAT family N-acetyltransferase [Pseudomonas sp. GD03766]UFH29099.1 GNAT family N-acetyltransferase [Pseudomonas sp. CIP-10]
MPVRTLTPDDLPQACALCMDAFMQAVAPTLSAQGIETFTQVSAPQAFAERMQGDNLMLACFVEGAIAGLIELKEGRHIAMLFIAPGLQRQGIGKRLMNAALEHASAEVVTVKASLSSVPAYQRYGFTLAGDVGEFAGLVYQPMEKRLPTQPA